MTEDFQIIDPPVGLHSTKEEIQAWIDELHSYKQNQTVKHCIQEAQDWLLLKDKH